MRLKAIWSEYPPFSRFVILVGLILFSAGIITVLGMMLVNPLFHIDLMTDPQALMRHDNPETGNALKFLQLLQSVGAFIIPAFLMALFTSTKPLQSLGLSFKPIPSTLLLASVGVLIAIPFINWLAAVNANLHLPTALQGVEDWMRKMEEQTMELEKLMLDMHNISQLLFMLFLMAFIPALGEEMIFRGIIQKIFKSWTRNAHVAILLTAIIFSAMHMQFLGFFPRLILGIFLGYLLEWTGSLWIPICVHFVNNGTAVIFEYLADKNSASGADTVGTLPGQGWMAAVSLIVALGIAFLIQKKKVTQEL